MSTAAAMATPKTLNSISDSVAKIENTATMIAAALVTTPALVVIPSTTAAPGPRGACRAAAPQFGDPAEDEHVVVRA